MEDYFSAESKPESHKKALKFVGLVAFIGIIAIIANFSSSRETSVVLAQLELEEQEFKSFIELYNKQYSSEQEYQNRFKIFRDNSAYARIFNTHGETYILGITEFSDLTSQEFSARISSPITIQHSEVQESQQAEKLSIPTSIDWTQKGAVTPVLNQGGCACGWAFSSVGAIESAWKISGNQLLTLSEQQLVDCSTNYGNKGCNGGNVVNAFQYVQYNGVTTASIYPYIVKQGSCTYKTSTKAVQIGSYRNAGRGVESLIYNAVALQPVSVAVQANQPAWQLYKGGIVSNNCGTQVNHFALIVGYDQTNSPPYWKVKNSWGASWGEAGYIRIAVVSGDGVCGIQIQPSYPIA
ncbi:unnamed protein product [Blepharisma stoltei]|uniref:Papain family cysteine protease n=1 Tax=Blepharisma stoltei TaxID=1481888 RepID=A0AAU9JV87_9CILI|nr:unnamed protein product [Blepharisma stoltei]